MDPKIQPQFNPNIPISEVLKQEQSGYAPSAPTKAPIPPYSPLSQSHSVPLSGIINTANNPDAGPIQHERIVKTFRSDAAEAIKSQHSTVTKIVMAEDKRRIERDEPREIKTKRTFAPVLVIIILVLLGGASIPAVQYFLNLKKQPVEIVGGNSIIPSDYEDTITLTKTTRDSLLKELVKLNPVQESGKKIENIRVFETIINSNSQNTTRKLASKDFAGLIGPNMPSALARSFDLDYMYGKDGETDPQPFIIFKTSSYDQAFAGMLKWETKMLSDLDPILKIGYNQVDQKFKDKVTINKDIRAVTDDSGVITFLYGFLDSQTLVITTNTKTFQDINTLFVAEHFVQ